MWKCVIHYCTDLIASGLTNENSTTFSCVATGYPDVQLLWWQTGTGENIAISDEALFNSASNTQEFNITLTSILTPVDGFEKCGSVWGHTCVFSNGGSMPITQDVFIHCPPGLS